MSVVLPMAPLRSQQVKQVYCNNNQLQCENTTIQTSFIMLSVVDRIDSWKVVEGWEVVGRLVVDGGGSC
jgi:hypothetical protein